jgi:lipoate-protein ligase A
MMNKQRYWKLYITGKSDPYYNMALDEFLLSKYEEERIPALRIYGWQESAISIGFNQQVNDAVYLKHCKDLSIPIVRRITGGSAIFHFDEITYSIICSEQDINCTAGIRQSYYIICSFIISFYENLGFSAHFNAEYKPNPLPKQQSTFCFSSCEVYDIIINNKKIGGNAQKRRKEIILQHGSIPISLDYKLINSLIKDIPRNISDIATCLERLLHVKLDFEFLQNLIIKAFAQKFSVMLKPTVITPMMDVELTKLISNKYRTDDWNYNKKY